MKNSVRILMLAALFGAGRASADNAPATEDLSRYADAASVVLAVKADFAPIGAAVRLAAFRESGFLKKPEVKGEGRIDESGVAAVSLPELQPGAYAFVAYYDENGDGKLNRSVIGRPREPFVFSNDVRPKLRKPRFDETKVEVAPGSVVVLTLKD